MSGKDPSSTSCEHLLLVVQLPQATSASGKMAGLQLIVCSKHMHMKLRWVVDVDGSCAQDMLRILVRVMGYF